MALGSKGGGGSRGRPYGMMLLLAFGAAVLGVMVLHKLRERRVFTLMIKDKDQDLMSLHLLLQKERESVKEMKRKIEDLKAKTYSLRSQKMDLSNKFAAIQSVTSSLKEEQRLLESTLMEKQNEIKMLRQRETDSSMENSQIAALRELLKQKEAEIEEMKRLLEKPAKIWSVSTDDPSNSPVNLTLPVISDKAGNWEHEEPDASAEGTLSERTVNQDDGQALIKGEGKNISEGTEMKGVHSGQTENLEQGRDGEGLGGRNNAAEENTEESQKREEVQGDERSKMVDDSQENQGIITGGEKDSTNKTGLISSHLEDGVVNTEGEGDSTITIDGKEREIKLDNPEGGEGRRLSKDGVRLKRSDRSQMVVGSKVRYGHRHTKRSNKRKIISGEVDNSGNGLGEGMGGNAIITDTVEQKGEETIQGGGRLDQNVRINYHDDGMRTHYRSGDINNFALDKQSEISGERNLTILEYSTDEGLRRSFNKFEKVNSKGRDQGAVSTEANKPGEGIRQQEQDNYDGDENPKNSETTHVTQQLEKTEVVGAAWTQANPMLKNEEDQSSSAEDVNFRMTT